MPIYTPNKNVGVIHIPLKIYLFLFRECIQHKCCYSPSPVMFRRQTLGHNTGSWLYVCGTRSSCGWPGSDAPAWLHTCSHTTRFLSGSCLHGSGERQKVQIKISLWNGEENYTGNSLPPKHILWQLMCFGRYGEGGKKWERWLNLA